MAKIKHNNFIDTVDAIFSGAREEGVLHLYAEDEHLTGRTIQAAGRQMLHFGTTGYLGLEQDMRLKEAAVSAIMKYGTQFPLSKSYISHPLYAQLESQLHSMYGRPVIVTKNSTLGHMAVIPCAVRDEDAVILDHQVHWSVQNACQLLKLRGIPVEMIRHSNLDMLEEKIRALSGRCSKIWYMADGVYSMFGDFAPVQDLLSLSNKYPQLHLYFDDVHGMSWRGKNGTGYVMDALQELPENVLLVGTLSKTFGASGATVISGDIKLHDKIRTFGGPLTFSAQLEPASVAAASASAAIHLSPEINLLQVELSEKIGYFNELIKTTSLPMVAPNSSPVFFLGTAMPLTMYKLINKLYNEGYFVNAGIYPAVPVKNTGIRITLSRHNRKEDIEGLTKALEYHFPKAIEETQNNAYKVFCAFGLTPPENVEKPIQYESLFSTEHLQSIKLIDSDMWNSSMGRESVFDWDGMCFLEKAFANNLQAEHRCDFHYYIIRDQNQLPVLITFFTVGLWKDDVFSPVSVSLAIEEKRKQDPFYLTSKVMGMGCLFTEGNHCYINKNNPLWEDALKLLLEEVEDVYNKEEADMLVLRDFEEDATLDRLFHNQGYIKLNLPETCVIGDFSWKDTASYSAALSARSRRHFMQEITPFETAYNIIIKEDLSEKEIEQAYNLYVNVTKNNYAVNLFNYPIDIFKEMSHDKNWEFILLYLKNDNNKTTDEKLVGVAFCYKNMGYSYSPSLVGMDYSIAREFQLYRQLLFQIIKRAGELGLQKIDFGITASFEKRKLGARIIQKVGYVQAKDNFSMEFLNTLQNDNRS